MACETPGVGSNHDIPSPPPVVSYLPKEPHPQATPQEIARLFDRIKDDLAPWAETGITQDMVERSYCTTFDRSFRLQVSGRPLNLTMLIASQAANNKRIICHTHPRRMPREDSRGFLRLEYGAPEVMIRNTSSVRLIFNRLMLVQPK